MSGQDALEQVVEGEAKMFLVDEFLVDLGDHFQKIVIFVISLILLLLEMAVDLLIPHHFVLNLFELQVVIRVGERAESLPQRSSILLRKVLTKSLNGFDSLVADDVLDGLEVACIIQVLDLASQFSSHLELIIIIMGCEVTSVYNDQIIGKVGYSKFINEDLISRDFRSSELIDRPEELSPNIKTIYGFTQSFLMGNIFFVVIANLEYSVYNAGRFVIISQQSTKQQKFIACSDFITAFDVKGKLCLTGVHGGKIILWDLQYLTMKVEILLPQGSLSVSTVGITPKYLFATDSTQPNNYAFCYDIRTAKLRAYSKIPTIEPAVRSVSIGDELYVAICSDGLWFIKAEKESKELTVVRGMFGQFPKTSMICARHTDKYVITGGVDGYIYVWKLSNYKCCRAFKVEEDELTAIGIKDNHLIISCINGKTKVYTYNVLKKSAKPSLLQIEEKYKQEQREEDIAFILVDSYDKPQATFAIAVSQVDPLLYHCLTREGLMFRKRLPAHSLSRKEAKVFVEQDIQRINSSAEILLEKQCLNSVYKINPKLIYCDVYNRKSKQNIDLSQERLFSTQQACLNQLAYIPEFQEVIYITLSNKMMVSSTFGRVGEAFLNSNQSDFGTNSRQISNLSLETVASLNFVVISNPLLFVTTNQSIIVFQRHGKLHYEEISLIKYENKIPQKIKVRDQLFVYENIAEKWRQQSEDWRSISQAQLQILKRIHCGKLSSLSNTWSQQQLSCGNGFIIFWK